MAGQSLVTTADSLQYHRGISFPAKLREALRFWLQEQVASVDGSEKVKALRTVSASMLPATLSRQFSTTWQPIFRFLDPVMQSIPQDNVSIADEDVRRMYDECIEFLKEEGVTYLWKERSNPEDYSLGTWSNKVSYSSIQKFGTDKDKSCLTEPTNRNNNKKKGSRKRSRSTNVKYPR